MQCCMMIDHFPLTFCLYIQNGFFGKHWPLTNNQKHFIVYNNMHVYIIKTNYPLFVQWVIDICPNPSFLPSWSTKTWAYFKSYIEGINILVTVRFYLMMFRLNQRWSTLTYYTLYFGVRWQVQKTIELGNTSSSNIKPFVYVSSTTWLGRIGWCNY